MATTTITTDADLMTLINVFTVDPEHQQELIDVLAEATTVMTAQPGFVSANLHRSDDGRRVVNYAQWRSRDDYAAMQANPAARVHMGRAAELATFDPIVCDVAYTGHV
jgi:heme-degrading monooxygenase HmoA